MLSLRPCRSLCSFVLLAHGSVLGACGSHDYETDEAEESVTTDESASDARSGSGRPSSMETGSGEPDAGGLSEDATLRFVHTAAGNGRYTLYRTEDGALLAESLSSGAASSYVATRSGELSVDLVDEDTGRQRTLTLEAPLTSAGQYTAVLYEKGSDTAQLNLALYEEKFGVAGEKARLRLVNLLRDVGYDVDVGANDPKRPEVERLAFGQATSPDGLSLAAEGAQHLSLVDHGDLIAPYTLALAADSANFGFFLQREVSPLPELMLVNGRSSVRWVQHDPKLYVVQIGQGTYPTYDFYVGALPDPTGYAEWTGGVEVLSELPFGTFTTVFSAPGRLRLEALAATEGTLRPRGVLAQVQTSMDADLRRGGEYLVPLLSSGFNGFDSSANDNVDEVEQAVIAGKDVFGLLPSSNGMHLSDADEMSYQLVNQIRSIGPRQSERPDLRIDLRPRDTLRGRKLKGTNIITSAEDKSFHYTLRALPFGLVEQERVVRAGSYVLDVRLSPGTGPKCQDPRDYEDGLAQCVAQVIGSFNLDARAGAQSFLLLVGRHPELELWVIDASTHPWTFTKHANEAAP